MKAPTAFASLRQRWTASSPSEQMLLRSAAVLVILSAVWWILVAPPLRTFTQTRAEQSKLDGQLQKMQGLRRQALALQAVPKISRDDALGALEAAVKQQLGTTAQLTVLGDSATLILRNTPADALAKWLPLARINAHAMPSEARLTRNNANAQGQALWSGTLVIRLPPQ